MLWQGRVTLLRKSNDQEDGELGEMKEPSPQVRILASFNTERVGEAVAENFSVQESFVLAAVHVGLAMVSL